MEIKQALDLLNKEKEIIKEELKEKENRLHEIDSAILTILGLVQCIEVICPKCNGKGQVYRRSCAEDDVECSICPDCHGRCKITIY